MNNTPPTHFTKQGGTETTNQVYERFATHQNPFYKQKRTHIIHRKNNSPTNKTTGTKQVLKSAKCRVQESPPHKDEYANRQIINIPLSLHQTKRNHNRKNEKKRFTNVDCLFILYNNT